MLGSHTPPCHRSMVITTQFSVSPCCTAARTSYVPLQVALSRGGGGATQGWVHNLLMQFFNLGSSKIEVFNTYFSNTVFT